MSENLTFELEDNKNEMRIISDIILGTEGGSCASSREPLLDRLIASMECNNLSKWFHSIRLGLACVSVRRSKNNVRLELLIFLLTAINPPPPPYFAFSCA